MIEQLRTKVDAATILVRFRYNETVPRIEVPSSNDVLVVPSIQAAEQRFNSYRADLETCGEIESCGAPSQG